MKYRIRKSNFSYLWEVVSLKLNSDNVWVDDTLIFESSNFGDCYAFIKALQENIYTL